MTARRTPSSAIKALRYMRRTERLYVQFQGGRRGYYEGVSAEDAAWFREAPSRGRALPAIKATYDYQAK